MAIQALTNVVTYIAGHDWTGDTNKATLSVEAEGLDSTTFGSGGNKEWIAGLKDFSLSLEGLWQSGTSDQVDIEAFPDLATDRAHTLCPTGVAGDVAYIFNGMKFNYTPWDSGSGDLAAFKLDSKGSDNVGIVRGMLAVAKQTVSSTGAKGSIIQLGAVSASQYLYATLHAFSIGTTITIQIQSDDNADFSTPTTRMTIGPTTTRGGTWGTRVAGPITDTYWRVNVSANTGSNVIAVAIGIK